MRRLIIILLSICILILAVSISIKPLIILLVRKHVGSIFVQSRITTGGHVLRIHREIRLFDIEIKRQGAYDIKIKEAAIQYNLFSIFKPGFLKLSLKEVKIYMNRPDKGIREFAGYLKVGPGNAPIFGYVEVSGLALDFNTLDVTAKAVLSWGINLPAQTVDYLDVKLDIFKMFGVQVQDALLKLGPLAGIENFKVAHVKYDKLTIEDIKGKAALQGKALSLSGVSAKTLDGDIQGDFKLEIDKGTQYLVSLQCSALDIEKFVRDFKLQEKFNMTGRLSGELKLEGDASRIGILKGNFSTLGPGGTLVITDTKFLENMAHGTGQPLDLLVESFKNYHYNDGLMTLGTEGDNVILGVHLEGEAGKRNLSVVLHDFKIKAASGD